MADAIVFSTGQNPIAVPTHTVYAKAAWADAWVEQTNLFCTSCTWSAAPEIPTATLIWRYGVGLRPTDDFFVNVDRKALSRYYIKIVFAHEDFATTNDWYGGIEVDGDQRGGTTLDGQSSGIQQLVCYGMEMLLDNHTIKRSWWSDKNFLLHTAQHGITFNKDGKKNYEDTTATFDGTKDTGENLTAFWNSRAIVDYLLTYAAPTPEDLEPVVILPLTQPEVRQTPRVPFVLGDTGFYSGSAITIPDYDQPVIVQDGKRTLEVLNSVLARQRLLSFEMRVNASNEVQLIPFSFLETDTPLGSPGNTYVGNQNLKTVTFAADASCQLTVTRSTMDAIDQVIVRGAKRRNCGTISKADSTIEAGWTSAHQTDYKNGASLATSPAYPAAAKVDERQKRNASARQVDKLRDVYARFVLPDDWDLKVNDGENGGTDSPISPVYNPTDPQDRDVVYRLYPPTIKILPTLPLLAHHDYSASKIDDDTVTSDGDGPYAELQPIVLTPLLEDTDFFVHVEDVGIVRSHWYAGTGEDRTWSGAVSVDPDARAIRVKVQGAPQHKIAKTDFVAIDSSDWPIDFWDWQDFIFTIAIEDDRYCEAVYPVDFPVGIDAGRTIIIDMGDGYRLDYVAKDTVVAVDGTHGTLTRSTSGGFVRDDRQPLEDIARIAWEWYSTERIACEWSTSQWKPFRETVASAEIGIRVGDMVTTIETGDDQLTTNTVVTSITIETPRSNDTNPGVPRITYTTQFAELDPLRFFLL